MGAVELLARLQDMGLRLRAHEGGVLVEPRAAITDEARHLIRENRADLLAVLQAQPLPIDLPSWCIDEVNARRVCIRLRSARVGCDLWACRDGCAGHGDGLVRFTVAEILELWAQGPPASDLVRSVLDCKATFQGARLESVRPDREGDRA